MATIVNKWYSSITAGGSSSSNPTAGGSFAPGDALIFFTWENPGTDTTSAPSGYSVLDFHTNALQVRVFGFISVTGSEAMPTATWSGGATVRGFIACYSGVDPTFTTGGNASDRTANTTQNLIMPAVTRTPSVDGCLCLYYGIKKKTATSDGTTFSPPGGTGFTVPVQNAPNGANVCFGLGEWIQTTATTIASGVTFNGSIADSSANMQTGIIILQPSATVLAPPSSGGIFVCP